MISLARFVMSNRVHAIALAVFTTFIPFLSWLCTIVVALTVLHRGLAAGIVIMMFILPAVMLALLIFRDPTHLVTLFGTAFMALMLRSSQSWELALLISVVFAWVGALLFQLIASDALAILAEALVEASNRVGEGQLAISVDLVEASIPGYFAVALAYGMIAMLVVSRWCQSALYNPGAFSKEFLLLRMSPLFSGCILAWMIVCYIFPEQYGVWLPLLSVPPVIAALALSHWFIRGMNMPSPLIAVFYIAIILFFQYALLLLLALALTDSWFDIRSRLTAEPPTKGSGSQE